jgi:pimeloyl-ACP methyl ester carboxylesterase
MMRRSARVGAALVAAVLMLCAGSASATAKTLWLCKPGLRDNPCEPGLATTIFSPAGVKLRVERIKPERPRKVDCFYVYPTVSDEPGLQAPLRIDPEQRSIALYQAARYSRYCRVYAPVYRQLTLSGIANPSVPPEIRETAYADVLAAWRTYLREHNRGRGVVLIGHSQGTFVLRRLVAEEIDPNPAMRRKLVSALLLGGNVTDADFKRIRPCRSRRQLACVVAFSTFGGPVPPDSAFGRAAGGREVLCTNPAALGGGAGELDPIEPTEPFAPGTIASLLPLVGVPAPAATTPWSEFPGAYRAHCSSADDAHVLQIVPLGGAPQLRPVPPNFGLHLVDANIGLGNLEDLVWVQARHWPRKYD